MKLNQKKEKTTSRSAGRMSPDKRVFSKRGADIIRMK